MKWRDEDKEAYGYFFYRISTLEHYSNFQSVKALDFLHTPHASQKRVGSPPLEVVRFRRIAHVLMCGASIWLLGAASANDTTTTEPNWWAFRAIGRPQPLPTNRGSGVHPIDAFVEARLATAGISPNPSAAPRELLRRLSYDLVGLPPAAQDLEAFEQDPSPAHWRQMIDRFLATPQYGERWARHWLDIVRFAQSNGYERDPEKLFAWRYRDYVIRSLNEDKPYDRFIREQLAGDVLAQREAASGVRSPDAGRQASIATGFLHLGVMDDEPDDKLLAEFDGLDDIVGTTGAAFLGLTLNCARCHDHKFDPLPQKDYYSLLSFFRGLRSPGKPGLVADSAIYAPLATQEELKRWSEKRDFSIQELRRSLAAAADDSARNALKAKIKELEAALPPFDHALAAREREDGMTPEVRVLLRGNPRTPGDVVSPGFPAALRFSELCEVRSEWAAQPSLRRLALADWIASPNNPLTARVMVNRIWHHHFGKGLVKSTLDFGRAGVKPSHPELLDWLAREFIDSGWSIKHVHRLILSSETWRRSSRAENPIAASKDPDNDLWWRQALRRLDAESLRDTLLAVSGQLNLTPGGRGFFPYLSGEVLAGGSRPGTDWEVSSEAELSRRSVYSFIRRSSMAPMFETFDYNNVSSPLGERPTTTVAPQALLMINDRFLQEQSMALAARLLREHPSREPAVREQWIHAAWQAVLGRSPQPGERVRSREFLERQIVAFEQRRQRLLFRPDVPDTLSTGYFNKLPASRFLLGPEEGWTYAKGNWPREYEGNRNMEPGRGPFGLWQGTTFLDGTVDCSVQPQSACESFSLLTRAVLDGDSDSGYELRFLPREGRVELRRLQGPRVVVLNSAPLPLMSEQGLRIRWTWSGDTYRITQGESAQVLLQGKDTEPWLRRGCFGVRAWGAALELEGVRVELPLDGTREVRDAADRIDPVRRGLESLGLLLMNLNEVAYVD